MSRGASNSERSPSGSEPEPVVNALHTKIQEVFTVYDHGKKSTVDVADVGTIIRSLGCCPTEAEVKDIIVLAEDPDNPGSVPFHLFLPVMTQVISDFKLQPSSAKELLQAFETLDKEGKGTLDRQMMTKAMMEEGEPFTEEEVEEMMALAVDPITRDIPYEFYINKLLVNVKPNIYSLVPKKSVVKKKKLGEGLL